MKLVRQIVSAANMLSGLMLFGMGMILGLSAVDKLPVPDFTREGRKGDSHDWNLGATGARGWIYASAGHSSQARQILVTKVAKGSPADGILNSGDVILGIGNQPFAGDARIEFARAITAAEQEQGGGELKLIRWREGKTDNVEFKLPVMGSYSDTVPYACPKSQKIFELGCKAIANKGLDEVSITNLTLLMGMVVAREAGVKDPEVDRVIAKASNYMRWYVNKGAIPYGDHAPRPGHEDNGKCSAAAVIFDEDLWLRIRAAQALSATGKPAMDPLPDLLRLLAKPSPQQDPRGMEQRYLCEALFDSRRGMLARSIEGVDREALYAAVRVGLRNEDGRARGSICSVYQNLSSEEIKPLLPAIHQAVVEAAPSGEMFADGVRVEGLKVLAKYRIEEGIDACVVYTRGQTAWASERRTPDIMKILLTYGARAKSAIPELKQLAEQLDQGEKNFPRELSRQKAKCVRETIRSIEASTDFPELIRLK